MSVKIETGAPCPEGNVSANRSDSSNRSSDIYCEIIKTSKKKEADRAIDKMRDYFPISPVDAPNSGADEQPVNMPWLDNWLDFQKLSSTPPPMPDNLPDNPMTRCVLL